MVQTNPSQARAKHGTIADISCMERVMQLGDLTVLDQLKGLHDQIETLDGRLRAMEEKRGQVADQVYVRVRADYAGQREQLVAQAAPLKVRARELYGQLQAQLTRLDAAFEDHRLATEELELRHALGEFDEAAFSARRQEIADQLGSKRSEREQALAIRDRFVAAFGSERELEAVPASPAPEATLVMPPKVTQTPPVPSSAGAITAPVVPVAAPPQAAETAVIPPVVPVPPVVAAPPIIPAVVAPPSAATSPVSPPKRGNPDGTLVFRPGRLLPLNGEAGMAPTTLSLKPIVIGSDNSCDVRISHAGIGRRHVEITMSRAGFVLRDVAGGNLVSVNGEVVSERILDDGDTIGVGPAQFQFKRG